MQKFSLNYINIVCGKEDSVKNCIILFHGYGGDGKDISTLAYGWKRYLDNTIIICPDGHEMCSINPSGRQWFDLSVDDPDYILEISSKLETKNADALFIYCTALPVLNILDKFEKKIQKPVLSSNQTLIWDTIRSVGYKSPIKGYGKLLEN